MRKFKVYNHTQYQGIYMIPQFESLHHEWHYLCDQPCVLNQRSYPFCFRNTQVKASIVAPLNKLRQRKAVVRLRMIRGQCHQKTCVLLRGPAAVAVHDGDKEVTRANPGVPPCYFQISWAFVCSWKPAGLSQEENLKSAWAVDLGGKKKIRGKSLSQDVRLHFVKSSGKKCENKHLTWVPSFSRCLYTAFCIKSSASYTPLFGWLANGRRSSFPSMKDTIKFF